MVMLGEQSMKVIAYLKGIPASNSKPEKPQMLKDFIAGVCSEGDEGILSESYTLEDCDVAILQGYVHEQSKNLPHLRLRQDVLDYQKQNNKRTIIIDSNLFLYRELKTKFFRFSYDGVFPNTGEYCNQNSTSENWNKIRSSMNFDLKPWKLNQGKYILICLQREGGWSMRGLGVRSWLESTISKIVSLTDRKIVIRPHPGDKQSAGIAQMFVKKNISVSNGQNLLDDLLNANCLINYNSSPAVASAIEGVPTFVLDPDRSPAANVSHHKLDFINNHREFDRSQWILDLAQCHWSFEDMKSGAVWKHMKKWAKN